MYVENLFKFRNIHIRQIKSKNMTKRFRFFTSSSEDNRLKDEDDLKDLRRLVLIYSLNIFLPLFLPCLSSFLHVMSHAGHVFFLYRENNNGKGNFKVYFHRYVCLSAGRNVSKNGRLLMCSVWANCVKALVNKAIFLQPKI